MVGSLEEGKQADLAVYEGGGLPGKFLIIFWDESLLEDDEEGRDRLDEGMKKERFRTENTE